MLLKFLNQNVMLAERSKVLTQSKKQYNKNDCSKSCKPTGLAYSVRISQNLCSRPVVGNHRAAARCRSVRSSLPGLSFSRLNALKHFCNLRSNYFRTFYEKERIIVQLLCHLGIVTMA